MTEEQDDFTIPAANTDSERLFLQSHLKRLREHVVRVAYYHGRNSRKDFNLSPDFKQLKVRWLQRYGCVDLTVHDERADLRHDLRVFGRNEYWGYSPHFDMAVAIYSDGVLKQFFPGIHILESIRQCMIPVHFNKGIFDRKTYIDLAPRVGMCEPRNGKWVCLDCKSRYEIPATAPRHMRESPKEKGEREKMTVSLRYEVLERCKFACGLCGRSPLKGDDIKLHVDHILPIAKGGKTTPDNLWALCADCNLGKSDRIVEQLAMRIEL